MNAYLKTVLLAALALSLHGCTRPAIQIKSSQSDSGHFIECHNGVVVSVSGPASDAGLSILKQGGNAVDAAVATAFALTVAYPPSSGMGGGGFTLIHPAPGKGEPIVIDFRESAPTAASPAMFTREESQFTQKSVAIPGTVRGFALAHQRFGTLPWSKLLQPAIALARDGFILDTNLAESMNITLAAAPEKPEFQRVFGKPGGGRWQLGDRLTQPDLARTLQLLADLGPDAFYKGPIADGIVAEMARGSGLITAADLAGYQAIERQPMHARYRGKYDVYVPPPPSSGGVCLLEELNMLDTFDLKAWGRWSPMTFHVIAEAMRRANYDRARYLGDPAFTPIPANLTTPEYGRHLAETINLHKATRSEEMSVDASISSEGHSTTQFSIIDKDGMATATTFTLERRWGSRVVVKDMGFLLNNDMRGFNLFPGINETNELIGTSPNTIANLIAPGKRPLSSMTPTIVAENGRVKLITGSPGSQAIPHTILCIMVNIFDFDMPVQTAVKAPRMSHQWLPDRITFEAPELYPEAMKSLKALGHTVIRTGSPPQGDAHTIYVIGTNRYIGVADWRINGKADGY
ncbi:MAG: ggt [Pedosphaera sp.]|nr:ggt [Pedosphaera sp.]